MNRASVSLAALLAASSASAQNVIGEEYINFASRPDAYSLVRATVTRGMRPYAGDLVVRAVIAWPYSETQTRSAVRVSARASRAAYVPVPMSANDSVTVSLDGDGPPASFSASGSPSVPDVTFVAVAGLGERVVFDITNAAQNTPVIAGAVRAGSDPGDVSLPTVASAWGGVHVVVAGTEALIHATPEARRALAEWVSFGGILAISARSTGDLRDPWITSLIGPVEEATGGSRRLAGMQVNSWNAGLRPSGLGTVMVLPMDLSLSSWNANTDSVLQLRRFLTEVQGAGGGVAAAGDLGLFRKTLEGGEAQSVLRPYVNLRPVLLPIAALLTLYIVAVGLMLGKRGAARQPLKRLMQLPVLASGVLGLVVVTSHFARDGASTARVIVLYDMASGSPVAMRRVFAGLTAGRSRTFDLPSPEGTLAVFRAGSSAANGVLRWDGARVSVERARLGLFETGMYYAEGRAEAGQGMTVTVSADGAPTLVNRTPWRVLEARYDDGARRRIWELGGVSPGASATATESHPFVHGSACDRLWGPGRWPTNLEVRGERPDAHRVVFDHMLADPSAGHHDGFLWALVALPDDLPGMVPGFRVEQSMALVRVVVPRDTSGTPSMARSRMGVRSYTEGSGPEPLDDLSALAGDGGLSVGDASATLRASGADAGVTE